MKRISLLCTLLIAAFRIYAQTIPAACAGDTEPAEDCNSTCISCNFDGYTGTTAGFTASSVPSFCSDIQNDQWIGFIASATSASFTVTPSACANGVQVALYGGCGENFIACNAGSPGGGNVPRTITANLVPGTNYYLLIDGYGGDQCDIAISVSPASAVAAAPVGPVGAVSGPIRACPGATLTYTVPVVSGAGTYTWTAPPGATINGQPSPLIFDAPGGRTVDVTFGAQSGQVCVKVDNTCFQGGTQCRDVIVAPIPLTTLQTQRVCHEEVPYTLPWGDDVSTSGTYSHTYMSYQGCDSMVQQQLVVKPAIVTNAPAQTICIGDYITVCGIDYYQTEMINQICTMQSYLGCDSTVNLSLTVLNPVANIIGSGTISCTNASIALTSSASPVGTVKLWKTSTGVVLAANANGITVTQPATIYLIATQTSNGVTCTKSDTIVITGNTAPVSATASYTGMLGCSGGNATLHVLTGAATPTYTWSGPGGFTSMAASPNVTVAGTYTVIVRDGVSGCTGTSSVTVTGNNTPPTASASAANTLTCTVLSTTLTATTNATTPTYSWSGPGGYSATGATPATPATIAGTYTVTITETSSGCTNTATVSVVLNNTPPGVMATVTGSLSCTTPNVTLNATTAATSPSYSWSGPSGFTSTLPNPSVSVAGNYTVTVTSSANGCTSSTTLNVPSNNSLPNISTAGATLSCTTQSAALTGNSTTPGVTYGWTGPGGFTSSQQNPVVNMVGNYILTVSATNGCASTSTAVVIGDFAPPTGVTATGGSISCAATAATIMGNSSTMGVTYKWTGPSGFTSTQQNPSVTLLGNYVLTVTGMNGCTASATATVTGNNTLPTVSASGGTITCIATGASLSATSSASNSTYSWSGPGGYAAMGAMPATLATLNGNYIVIVTDLASTCTATATAMVTSNTTPPGATATVTGMLSCPTPTVTINANTAATNPTFSWSGPSFTSALQNPTISGAGTYTVTVTGSANGCTSTASVIVLGDNSLPNATATGTALNCTTLSDTITGTTTSQNVTFKWTGPNGFMSTQQNPVVAMPGAYVLTVSSTNGCTATSTATVTGNFVAPTGVTATGGVISCTASMITLMGNSATAGVTYSWTGPGGFTSNQQNPSVNTVGDYILTVTGTNGCTATATTAVTPDANLPDASASGDTLNCTIASVTLNGASMTTGVTPLWAGPNGFTSNQFTPTVTQPGTYTLTVNNPVNGCSAQATAVVVLDTVAPGATAVAGTLTCTNPNFTLSGSSTATNVNWSWAGPGGFTSTQQNPVVTAAGTYTLTVTGLRNGCISTSSAILLANQSAPVAATTTGNLTCTDTSITLNGSSTLMSTYNWSGPGGFTSSNQNITVSVLGDYILTVMATNGCTDSDTATVTQDIAPPGATAQGDTITCAAPTVSISVSSTATGATYKWSGPNGFTSTLAMDTVNAGGPYNVTVTGSNGCTSTATAMVEANTELPVLQVSAPDTLTCITTTVDIQATINNPASPIQTLAWTGPGGFTSSVEDPSVTAAGLYNLVATSANGCTSAMNVTVNENVVLPNATAQGGTLTCKTISLNLDGNSTTSNVEFSWTGPAGFTATQSDPSVNVDGTYVLTVTASNGCTSSATTTVAIDTIAPGANAVSTTNLSCDSLSTTLQGSSPTASVVYEWSGPGAFSSTDQDTTTMVPGTYSITVTSNANGCISVDSVAVTQNIASPNASAVGNTIDCTSGSATLTGNSTTPNVTYAWTGPGGFTSTNQNPSVNNPGDYILTVTGPNGCTAVDTAVVNSNQNVPNVVLSAPQTLTCTNDTLTITGTVNSPASGFTAVWSGPAGFTSTDSSIQITVPGPYTYTVTNTANGCKAQPSVTIDQDIQAPQGVIATGGLLNCTNPTISLDASTTTTGVTYTWTGPGGFTSSEQKPQVSNAGTYTVIVTTTANGCTDSATAEVTQDPTVPNITVTTDTLTCSLDSVVLKATTTTPNVTFVWQGPGITNNSTEQSPTVSVPGPYKVTVTAVSGCTSTFDIVVAQNIAKPTVTTQGDTLTCTVPTGTISATSATGITYAWSGPGGFTSALATATVNVVGTYTVTVTAANGCTQSATAIVSPDSSIPQVTTTGGMINCKIDSVTLLATSSVPVTWLWSGPGGFTSTQQNPTVTAPGDYTVTATASNGCSTPAAATVSADTTGPNVSLATPGQLDCATTRVNLNATVQTAGNYTFTWTTTSGNILTGASTPTPQVSAAGNYVITVLNNVNGCTTIDSVSVRVDPSVPSAAPRHTRNVTCFGDTNGSIVIDSIIGGTGPFVYSIDNLPFGPTASFNSLPPGVHSIVIQDAKGCELEVSAIIMEPEELIVALGPDTTIHLGDEIILSLNNIVNDTSRIAHLTFTPVGLITVNSSGLDTLHPTYSFRYQAMVVDSNGCKASDERAIIVDKTRYVYIPNIFYPESTTDNNLFMITGGKDVARIKTFQVYDRWGQVVHEYFDFLPNDVNSAWDGKIKGKKANPAVFVYYAEIEFVDGETVLYKGDVMLMH